LRYWQNARNGPAHLGAMCALTCPTR